MILFPDISQKFQESAHSLSVAQESIISYEGDNIYKSLQTQLQNLLHQIDQEEKDLQKIGAADFDQKEGLFHLREALEDWINNVDQFIQNYTE